jgi:hypothetical protein
MVTRYQRPRKKITVTHGGTDYQLEDLCTKLDIYQQENVPWNAEMSLVDQWSDIFDNKLSQEDIVKIYLNYEEVSNPLTAADLRFHGFVEEDTPHLDTKGSFLEAKMRAYSRCITALVCGQQYGVESRHASLDTAKEILVDPTYGLIPLWVNKLLGDGSKASGYTLDTSLIEDIAGTIPFLEFPYKPVLNDLDDLLDMISAIKGDSSPGAHWIVKPEEVEGVVTNYLLFGTVGNHPSSPNIAAKWSNYWNGTQGASTIAVMADMIVQNFSRQRKDANLVLLVGNFRKPGDGDYWTENHSSLWGTVQCTLSDEATTKIVGGYSLKAIHDTGMLNPTFYYPSAKTAAWDFLKCGTAKIIPLLDFYVYIHGDSGSGYPFITMWTSETYPTHYYQANINEYVTELDKWIHISLPIGPYYDTVEATRKLAWVPQGSPSWGNINWIEFGLTDADSANHWGFIDGLHFSGQVIRSAKKLKANSDPEDHYLIKVIPDNIAKDDSLHASDDSGAMARIAYAELLKSSRTPIIGEIAIAGMPQILPGQLAHIHACKTSAGTYRIDKDMRITQHHLSFTAQGFISYLQLTDDLYNSRPMTPLTAYNLIRKAAEVEFQNRQSSSIKAWPLDVSQAILEKTYPFSSSY